MPQPAASAARRHISTSKYAIALLLITVISMVVLITQKPEPRKRPLTPPAPLEIDAFTPQLQPYRIQISSQGRVEAGQRVELATQVHGVIQSRSANFERGGRFQQGEVLVTIDEADYRAALMAAIAEQKNAQHQLSDAKARSKAAISDWKRRGKGGEPSDFVAKRTQVAAAEASLAAAEARVFKAELDLDRTQIKAPFAGSVVSDVLDAGNFVAAGRVLGTVIAADQLQVALPVSARWRSLLESPGDSAMSVEISLPNLPEARWQAQITGSVAEIDSQSRQLTLMARIDPQSGSRDDVALLVGDFVQARIQGALLENVMVIPREALQEGKYVWAVRDSRVFKTPVKPLWTDARVAVIDQGIAPGSLIASAKLGNIISGTEVAVKQRTDSDQLLSRLPAPATAPRAAP